MRIAKNFASIRKSRSRNTKVTSDFRPEVEIWPFRACTMHPANCDVIFGNWAKTSLQTRSHRRQDWTKLFCLQYIQDN